MAPTTLRYEGGADLSFRDGSGAKRRVLRGEVFEVDPATAAILLADPAVKHASSPTSVPETAPGEPGVIGIADLPSGGRRGGGKAKPAPQPAAAGSPAPETPEASEPETEPDLADEPTSVPETAPGVPVVLGE
jgi:hypothetical protein